MQRPSIYVLKNQQIADALVERFGDAVVQIRDQSEWDLETVLCNAQVILAHSRHSRPHGTEVNPSICLELYRQEVEDILADPHLAPKDLWQPASLIDCHTEKSMPIRDSLRKRMHILLEKLHIESASRFSCVRRIDQIVRSVTHALRHKAIQEKRMQEQGESIGYSSRIDPYLLELLPEAK